MRLIRDHKAWAVFIFLVIGCTVGVLATYPYVFRRAAELWIVSDTIDKPADVIVVLGGGFDYRPRAAADLYKQGLGRAVWVTHAKVEQLSPNTGTSSPSTEEPSRALLINLGVPDAAIVGVPGEASNTFEEATLVSNLIRATGGKSLIVPTDPFHTFRVKWIFTKLVGDQGIKVFVRPIFTGANSPASWWQSVGGRTFFAYEIAKYIYYRFRY